MLTMTKEEAQQFLIYHFQLNEKVSLTDTSVVALFEQSCTT